MSINNGYRIQIIESDGETTRYNFECFIYKKEDLKIKVMDDKANITELEYGNDYNVENQFDYYNGGYFNLAEPQKKGIYIVIYRETPIDQQINFMSLQAISPMNLTKMFDKLTVICQELNEQFYRSMKFDFTDISLIEQDKPLDETNIKNIDKESNNDYVVALTLKYNQETSKWELATSKTNPDDKKEQGSESDYGVYKIATTEETKIGEDDTKIITPLKLKNGIDDRIATQEEAIEGLNDKKYITPKTINETIKSYIADTETSLTGEDNIKYITPKTVNETIKNYIATPEEAVEGIDDIKYITPNTLKTTTDNRIATNEEAIAGTDDIKLMTPLKTLNSITNYMNEKFMTDSIFKYSELKNYSKGDLCFCVNEDFIPKIYYSIVNNNLGNNPLADENNDYWEEIRTVSGSFTGQLIKSTIPLNDANLHLADGDKIIYNGIHKNFYSFMEKLYDDETIRDNIFCTEEEYNNSISLYGNCGKYVFVKNEYVRLPTINGWIETTTAINNNGKTNEAGLPNITGKFGGGTNADQIGTYWKESAEGAFYNAGWLVNYMVGKGIETKDRYTQQRFDASRSNDIYGNSDTVTPRGIKYLVYIVLGTTKNANVEIDINNITNDINNLSNRIYIEDTYADDNGSFYRKYSDGWVEQGGKLPTSNMPDVVENLLVPYKDTNYHIYKNIGQSSPETSSPRTMGIYNKTNTSFQHSSSQYQTEATWYAFGYYR